MDYMGAKKSITKQRRISFEGIIIKAIDSNSNLRISMNSRKVYWKDHKSEKGF